MKMCELLGMSFNLPVNSRVSLKGFRLRGEENPDGWGLAFYPDESAQIIKEPTNAKNSNLSEFLQEFREIQSRIFIGHVRRTSVGSKTYKNTHPFNRELNGKEYVFAHNGTLCNYENLNLGRFKPIGETDSEYAFCHLLSCIEERGINEWKDEDFDWLNEKLREINEYGSFNCIFSDGEHLFCYHDKDGYNGLCFTHRKPPYDQIKLLDNDWDINLAGEKDPKQTGFIVATRRLTNEHWEDFKPGELIVFKDGMRIYSNR
jgi:glutamine amidotransferase